MVAKRGMVGVLAAIGAAMLFVVSAAAGSLGGYDVNDAAAVGSGGETEAVETIDAGSDEPVADRVFFGYVLDNATGGGIAGATVIIIHVPEDVKDADAYVEKVLSVLKRVREKVGDRREKLEEAGEKARQKLEEARERLENSEEKVADKKERLRDAMENANDRPGGGRKEMKRIEKGLQKIAEAEKKLGKARERLDEAGEKAREKLREMEQRFEDKKAELRERLAAKGIIIVRTDEGGRFEARVPKGACVIVAVAPGYSQGRLAVDVPSGDDEVPTLRLDAKPRLEVYRLKFVWGYLDEANPEGEFMAWNGSIEVSDGAVKLLRTVQFEHGGRFMNGGNDKVYPQRERDTLSWRSSTTVARDGVVVLVVVRAGAENAEITLTAGEWSKTVRLARLEGERFRIPVGEAGHEILVACELLDRPAM
jgi:hypothetical protein